MKFYLKLGKNRRCRLWLKWQNRNLRKYSQKYVVAYYESDKRGDLRIVSLMNLLQNAAQGHALCQGVGIGFMSAKSRAWMTTRYAIKIIRMPRVDEKINILTWISDRNRLAAIREFLIKDAKGNSLVEAVSKWVLVDLSTKKIVDIPPMPIWHRSLFPATFPHGSVKREDYSKSFAVCYDNIDVNQHVNNSLYPLWASESVDQAFRADHSLSEVIISFKKEAVYGEDVMVTTQQDGLKTTHRIASKKGEEHAKVTIKWN